MIPIYLLLLIFINLAFSVSISGTIRDQKTGEPLPYANIIITETDLGTASDINGYYIIPSIY